MYYVVMINWILLGILLFASLLLVSGIRIVRPVEVGIIERLGKFKKSATQGFNWIIPVIDQMYKVNMTEQMVDCSAQRIITKDDLNAEVDAVVYYRITNPEFALYNVDDVDRQVVSLAQTTLRNVIGTLTLSDANAKRNEINGRLEKELQVQVKEWGLRIVRVEMQRIEPPQDVQQAMNDVVTAERKKTAAVNLANAAQIEADGFRRAAIERAKGEREARILSAEGESQAVKLIEDTLGKSEKYIDWLRVDRWDGRLPAVTGGATPLVDVSKLVTGVNE